MSIVEIVVALTVFAVGIVAVFSITDSSFKVATGTTHRARATAIATKHIETARSIPWDALDVTGAVTPVQETVGGSTFLVSRTVEEMSAGGNPDDDVKRVTVLVEWTDGSGGHDVAQSTYVFPAGPPSTTTPTGTGALPLAPVLNTVTNIDGAVRLNWTPPSTGGKVYGYVIRRAVNSWATGPVWWVTKREPPQSTSFLVRGLAASTTYLFQVGAIAANGNIVWSGSLSTTTAASVAVDCRVASASVTPGTVNRVSPFVSALTETPVITVETSGSCTGFNASYDMPDGTEVNVPLTPISVGAKVFSGQVSNSGSAVWEVGEYRVSLTDSLTNDRGTTAFTVCDTGSECG